MSSNESRINAFPAAGSSKEPYYLSKEAADKVAWEPCEWHIEQIIKSKRSEATRKELRKVIHFTCACLHLANPALYSAIHPGGAEELFRRTSIQNDDDRSAAWRDQKAEVDEQLALHRPSMVYVNEDCENNLVFDHWEKRISITTEASVARSCV